MSSRKDTAALLDIHRAAHKILRYKQDLDKSVFLADDKTQSAIIFQLLIIGEAVKRLSQELRTQHPEIPWSLTHGSPIFERGVYIGLESMNEKACSHYDRTS